jgi:glucose-1-phosphate thymidylyltransferase
LAQYKTFSHVRLVRKEHRVKGIILAGGTGSRLKDLVRATNKHLLPVGKQPMIFWPIKKLVEAGIDDILIITGTEHMGSMVQALGSGKYFNAHLTYKVQDEAGGIAQALNLARGFAYSERMAVLLGDNIFEDSLIPYVEQYNKQTRGGMVLLKAVQHPNRFGVGVLDDAGVKLVRIDEKPEKPESNLAVTGIYFYDQRVFDIIDTLEPSGRGELEITDVNNCYIEWGELKHATMDGWWTDAGTLESLAQANELVKDL